MWFGAELIMSARWLRPLPLLLLQWAATVLCFQSSGKFAQLHSRAAVYSQLSSSRKAGACSEVAQLGKCGMLQAAALRRSGYGMQMKLDVSPAVARQFGGDIAQARKIEQVVREAERVLKSNSVAKKELGMCKSVEVCVGAGIRANDVVMVRFFAIFSKSPFGGSSYSCNVSATGKISDGTVTITKLSCAKDEGWGRTVDVL